MTCGVSINHLTLNENDIGPYRTFFKPAAAAALRGRPRAPWCEALAAGDIDVIVSSHDPQDADAKRHPFAEAADGAVGLETLLPPRCASITPASSSSCTLLRAHDHQPRASLLGLPSGRLAKGAPADLILVDLDRPGWSNAELLRSRSKNSPFDESKTAGPRAHDPGCRPHRLPIR